MNPIKIVHTVAAIIILTACSTSPRGEETMEMAIADSVKVNNMLLSSSAAVENGDTSHRFIRKAELKFRVRNVVKATLEIERMTERFKGFVTFTELSSDINQTFTTAISRDSVLETIKYTVSNSMVLRIPNTQLDTVLRSLGNIVDFLEYRRIHADDVKLQLLSNELVQRRGQIPGYEKIAEVRSNNRTVLATRQRETDKARDQEVADNARISNLSLEDEIAFSTVRLSIYQRPETKQSLIANVDAKAFEPGFGTKIVEALQMGIEIFKHIILFFARVWVLVVIAVVVWVVIKLKR